MKSVLQAEKACLMCGTELDCIVIMYSLEQPIERNLKSMDLKFGYAAGITICQITASISILVLIMQLR